MGLALAIALSSLTSAEAATRRSRNTPDERNESWYGRSLPSKARSKVSELQRQDPLEAIPIPILLGVEAADVYDSWGDARSQGRVHEGTDIMAPRGAYVVAPAESVVSSIGVGANGGNFVYTINPGGERFYFAHLDAYAEGLEVGDILEKGDLIGYVGNTGNASGGPTHLHFGIYAGGAQNPYPRLTTAFTLAERIDAAGRIVDAADDGLAEARKMVNASPAVFRQAAASGIRLQEDIAVALAALVVASPAAGGGIVGARDLTVSMQGSDVTKLQTVLIAQARGSAASALAGAGATGYFGPLTQRALAEWQAAVGISPAAGYFGPITRARFAALGL